MKKLSWIIAITLFVLNFSSCKSDGFSKDEKERIFSGETNSIMKLFTTNEKSDSLLLREKARIIDTKQIGGETLEHFRKRLLATVNDSTNAGVGIAAPQVGISLRMIYVQRFDKAGEPFEVYYNPEITEMGDSINSGPEGCLSVPHYRGVVDRAQNITLVYLDSLGVSQKEEINGFTSVIFQHEIDHINGKLYFDHISGGMNSLTYVD